MGDSLRLGGLLAHVARLEFEKIAIALEPALFARSIILRRRPAAGKEAERDQQVDMDTDHAIGILVTQLRRNDRAPVAALGREFPVAEHVLHQLYPEIGSGPVVNPGFVKRRRKAVA